MQDINTLISNNYNENINYVQTYHPKLFQKLTAYENALDNGYYKEKYELIYENDTFDVVEKESSKKLYNKNLESYSQLVTQSVSFSPLENSFQTFIKSQDEVVKLLEESTPQDINPSKLHKFIHFGVGLGEHIVVLDKKIAAQYYLIVEDDLELFRLSLFVTNYKKFAEKKQLFFAVFEEEKVFKEIAQEFLDKDYFYNHYIKFFHMLHHKEDKITAFHLLSSTQAHLSFFYKDMLKQLVKSIPFLKSNYKYIKKTLRLKEKRYNKKPYLLIAAGPSLQTNIEWLKINHENFTIVSISAALMTLQKHNIKVDLIVSLDGLKGNLRVFKTIQNIEFFKDSLCLFSDKLDREILEMFPKENTFLFEGETHYKEETLKPISPCIGSLSYQLMLIFEVKELYLLGLDLAIDEKSGKTHVGEHLSSKTLDITKTIEKNDTLEYKKTLIKVRGNHQETVLTTAHFNTSIDAIELSINFFQKEYQKIYNLSDGARFSKTIPIRVEDIRIKKKTINMLEILKDTFNTHSYKELTQNEYEKIQEKSIYAQKLFTELHSLYSQHITSNKKLKYTLKELVCKLDTTQDIDKVLDVYLKSTLTHIFYFFDITSREDSQLREKVYKMLFTKVLETIQIYKDNLMELQK